MDDSAQLLAFLTATLALWRVPGRVEAGAAPPIAAKVCTESGAIVWIERPERDSPFRWHVRWRAAGADPNGVRELRPRACGSLVGVLAAMRTALDVDRGTPLHVAAAPAQA